MSVSITIDDTEVRKAFLGMTKLVKKQRRMMIDIGDGMVTRVVRGFEAATDPYGKKWQKLAKSTKVGRLRRNKSNFKKRGGLSKRGKRAVSGGFQPLSDKGSLKRSITRKAYGDSVEVGTNVEYAATHQFGRKITGKAFKGTIIPARPFLPTNGLPRAWKDDVLDTMQEHMQRAIRG